MRILFASTGGAGHVTPMLPLARACRQAGHEVVLVGPPMLSSTAEREGLRFVPGALPDEAETGPLWARVPQLPVEEAERLVVGQIFATLNVRAMLPTMRDVVRRWAPDVVVREPAEFASAVVADSEGVPSVQVGVGLIAAQQQITELAEPAVEGWRRGLSARIADTPYLTFFPPTLDSGHGADPSPTHRFRLPSAAPGPLPVHWPGDDRPLVYVTFGSVAATVPFAAPIYRVALEAVADLPARVLLTTGEGVEDGAVVPSGPHVHVARWVPQADVLAQADVVVCHGGSGTTLGALAAGVPLVITPLFADQPMNARRVGELGAGVVVRPRDAGAPSSAVEPSDLRRAIAHVLDDPAAAVVARGVAEEIAALPPADDAVAVITAAG
ncbi:glycosyltransferase [Actinomycetospora sp. TBRC 11914]|uniref:glycosyltransferase n=1 Tax=Actinomycetospora sp. TBRC 11914 TaxID=2729387 RepID=UPI00145F78F9|nr:glycosyltransferase [Actinomycetospora sp. TBRC 11914]NMO92292.1 glycosyltransferase family 1 protein [Actinomycetospora sp. TBRC 11914]